MREKIKTYVNLLKAWALRNPEKATRMAFLGPVTAFAFAVAASHTLQVGDERAHVTGWKAWSVAGALEILAAYAFFLFLRSKAWRRIFPLLVFLSTAFMVLWINLASVKDYSWATIKVDPWPAVFAVTPGVVFLLGMALMEVDSWRTPPKRQTPRGGASKNEGAPKGQGAKKTPEKPAEDRGTSVEIPTLDPVTLARGRKGIAALEARGVKVTGETLRIEMGTRKDTALRVLKIVDAERRAQKKETA